MKATTTDDEAGQESANASTDAAGRWVSSVMIVPVRFYWLPPRDSNPDKQIQNLLSYH